MYTCSSTSRVQHVHVMYPQSPEMGLDTAGLVIKLNKKALRKGVRMSFQGYSEAGKPPGTENSTVTMHPCTPHPNVCKYIYAGISMFNAFFFHAIKDRLTTRRSIHKSRGTKFIYSSFSYCQKMYAYAYRKASEEAKLENTISEFLPSASPIQLTSLEQQLTQSSE